MLCDTGEDRFHSLSLGKTRVALLRINNYGSQIFGRILLGVVTHSFNGWSNPVKNCDLGSPSARNIDGPEKRFSVDAPPVDAPTRFKTCDFCLYCRWLDGASRFLARHYLCAGPLQHYRVRPILQPRNTSDEVVRCGVHVALASSFSPVKRAFVTPHDFTVLFALSSAAVQPLLLLLSSAVLTF